MAKIGVVGAGSWGTALSTVVAKNGHDVTVWSYKQEEVDMLRENHEHVDKLPGVRLDESICFTSDLEEAIKGKDLVVIAVPSPVMRETAEKMKPFVAEGQILVDVAKGIEEKSLKTMSEVVHEVIPQSRCAVLSGPSHAEEVGRHMATTVVAGSKYQAVAEYVQNIFMNDYFRVYTSPDVLGIGLGGALKNVIALAAGMADGVGGGDNTKAALITRGIKEITRLALRMGAYQETIEGLTGMGDLIVTCASMHSRNRRAGILMGQGYTMEEAMAEVKMVVEGVYSAKAAKRLGEIYDCSLPIVEEVNMVLFEGKNVKEGMLELMQRDKKSEHTHLIWEM